MGAPAEISGYSSRLYSQPLDTLYAEAKAYAAQGFKSVKIRFGWGPKDGLEGMHKNVDLVKTTREAVGPNVDIMADCYIGWTLEYARRMLRMLAPFEMRWVEEPVISDDLHAYAELKALNLVNISGGEHNTRWRASVMPSRSRHSISHSSTSTASAASRRPRRSPTSARRTTFW